MEEGATNNQRRRGRMAGRERVMNRDSSCSGDCKNCKSGKPCAGTKKDGMGCGSKRGDALTPQEYLTACELGIHDRSRTYIRARLDAMQSRGGKKCGGSVIPANKTCRKGAGGAAAPGNKPRKAGLLEKGLKVGGALATGYGVYSGLKSGTSEGLNRGFAVAHAGLAAVGAGTTIEGKRKGNKNIENQGKLGLGLNAALAAGSAYSARNASVRKLRIANLNKAFRGPAAPRSDSKSTVYAEGF